jgi:hypothetical protein
VEIMADQNTLASQQEEVEEVEGVAPPSRPAKHPCIGCKKNVGRNSVRCKTCQLWVHLECGGISKEVFSILANPTKYGGVSWTCDSCQASAARLEDRMNALEGRFQEVENRVIRSEAVVQEATKRVDAVETRQSKLEQELERERERVRRERAEEMRERDMRRKSVVMHRVGEAGDEVRTVEGRKEWDLKSCDNIFKALKMNFTSENAVKFCRRVGEKGAGPRPMVVGFRREAQKEDLLESAKDLRNTHFSEVSIIPDLTQEQRKEEAEMVSEAERRNGDLSEEDRTKNLEWMVVGARGERRIVKGVKRAARGRPPTAAARGGTPTTAARGGTPTAAARGGLTPQLLPALPQQGAWDPRTRGRGGAAGARGRGGAKRRRGEQVPEGSEEEEEEEVMEDSRQAPPQPGRT